MPRAPGALVSRGALCVAGAVCILQATASLNAQPDLRVSCLPDRATTVPGERVSLRIWVASSGQPVVEGVTARWTATAGQLDARDGVSVTWNLDAAAVEKRHIASVEARVNGVAAGTCELGVWLMEPPAGPAAAGGSTLRLRGEYVTRRAFLRAGQAGEPGFGLYTYFLMREPATADERARASAFVAAFLDSLVGVSDQENYIERRRLNGSYMPVTADLPAGLTSQQRSAWTLDHYDYEYAKRLLSFYPALAGAGPFIVAVPLPLRSQVKPMLPWDLSLLAGTAIPEGVSRFLNQAAQLYDWQNQNALQKLRDQLLTAVAGMFVGRVTAENWLALVR